MVRKILLALLVFNGISSVAGGLVVIKNTMDWPLAWLGSSPFDSYVWPGIILMAVVGGTHLLAAKLLKVNHKYSYEASATASFGMLIWVFMEIYILKNTHWLQIAYFAVGIVTLVLILILIKYKNLNQNYVLQK